jgi:hypothetical protein
VAKKIKYLPISDQQRKLLSKAVQKFRDSGERLTNSIRADSYGKQTQKTILRYRKRQDAYDAAYNELTNQLCDLFIVETEEQR